MLVSVQGVKGRSRSIQRTPEVSLPVPRAECRARSAARPGDAGIEAFPVQIEDAGVLRFIDPKELFFDPVGYVGAGRFALLFPLTAQSFLAGVWKLFTLLRHGGGRRGPEKGHRRP